jgi:ferrous iron transport protein B
VKRKYSVALAGNPNCGKTTIFNSLTGLKYKVGNYPGVTVEKKLASLSLGEDLECEIFDLPGTYTLYGESLDEQVASKAIAEKPDLIVAVIDASNLERNLYLLSELIDTGLPIVAVLNMNDLASKRGLEIYDLLLSRFLDLPVLKVNTSKKQGADELKNLIGSSLKEVRSSSKQFEWADGDETLIATATEHNPLSNPDNYAKVASRRYKWINSIVKKSVVQNDQTARKISDTVDIIATHRVWGLVMFFAIMSVLFQSLFSWSEMPMDAIDSLINACSEFLLSIMPDTPLRSLLVDGVLAGVGSVVIFVPQIALLFFFIGLLEDSGYLTRAAFVMDRVMRQFGLQGRSFIPLLSSFACAVPGIMSARSIPSIADRFVTILVAPLMSCSARLPIYTVLIAAFIPHESVFGFLSLPGLTLLAAYLLGIIGAAFAAKLFKKFLFKGEPALFVMEMPPFRLPSLKVVLREVWDRVLVFIRDAGTVILACSIVLWFVSSYPKQHSGEPPMVINSYAGMIGRTIEPVIEPLGFDWEIGIGLLASFAAREVFISSLATVYNLESEDDSAKSLTNRLKERNASGKGMGLATALSLLVFYVFACQCMSTLAVCRREMGSWKWPIFMFLYMTLLAYAASFATYEITKALTT